MPLSSLSRRDATAIRLLGLGLVLWSIIGSNEPPAWHGRGLVVLALTVLVGCAWLSWTTWSFERRAATVDLYVLAACGGLLTAATPNSAASAAVFAAAVVAAVRARLAPALTVVGLGIASIGIGAIVYHGVGAVGWLAYSAGLCAAALVGSNRRQMLLRAEQAELLLAQTQRSREEQLRAARLEESTRIARDIHDVLAHALAGLAIQLEATDALLANGADVESVRARVQRAHELARQGLDETRRAVGALRGDARPALAETVQRLVADHRAITGASVELELEGDLAALDDRRGEAVVRTVQEALTNVRKHASGAAVAVAVAVTELEAVVTVRDRPATPATAAVRDAPTPPTPPTPPTTLSASGGGYGLIGMRERAEQLGGTLAVGPAEREHGWQVTLRLPIGDEPPAPAPEPAAERAGAGQWRWGGR